MFRSIWIAGLLAGGIAACVSAQEISAQDLFVQLDKNGDGKLETEEIPAGQYRFFERVLRLGDHNQDGSITLEELAAALREQPASPDSSRSMTESKDKEKTPAMKPQSRLQFEQILQRFDKNGDGSLTREELPEESRGRLEPLFERLNTDSISLEKLHSLTFSKQPAPDSDNSRIERGRGERDQHSSTSQEGEALPRRSFALLRLLDKDQNGTLSQMEWAAASQVFGELDQNQDGELTPGELLGIGEWRGGSRRTEGRPMNGSRVLDELFRRMDANGDEMVSPEEAPARLRESFSKLDQDSDGQLTMEELRTGLPQLRRERPPETK